MLRHAKSHCCFYLLEDNPHFKTALGWVIEHDVSGLILQVDVLDALMPLHKVVL